MPRLSASSIVPNSRWPSLRRTPSFNLFALFSTTRFLLYDQNSCSLCSKSTTVLEPCSLGPPALYKGLVSLLSCLEVGPQKGHLVRNYLYTLCQLLHSLKQRYRGAPLI